MSTEIDPKSAMEAITKLKSTNPPQFLSQNPDLSHTTRLVSQHFFALLKPNAPKSPFEHLLTVGFDSEQIWQQIDIQSHPLVKESRRNIARFEKNPEKITEFLERVGLIGGEEREGVVAGRGEDFVENPAESLSLSEDSEDGEEDEEEEEEEEEEESEDGDGDGDEEEEDDVHGVPEVEDEFLKMKEMGKFLISEEKKEYGGDENSKKRKRRKKGGEESESDDDLNDADANELLMYGDDDNEDGANYRYEDFCLPNKKVPKSRAKRVEKSDDSDMEDEKNVILKSKQEQFNELDQSDEDEPEIDNEDETQGSKNLSTHEKELQKLQIQMKQMEKANLAAKDWTMQGEVTASKRPRDSALEVDLDFEHNLRPAPVITEEVTTSLEDIIKKRISEGQFDDVQRAPKLPSAAPKEKKELDDNKSKKGLAEIYEEEYAQQTGLAAAPLSHNDELRKEASGLFKKLCLKLDALSHFHFAPKPVVEDMSIPTNAPALVMEEIAPVAVSDAAMLAPEEVFAGKGDIKEDTELTKEDRKRRRATKKRKFKAINVARTVNQTADKALLNNGEGKEA